MIVLVTLMEYKEFKNAINWIQEFT
jgi:hypothetical protein